METLSKNVKEIEDDFERGVAEKIAKVESDLEEIGKLYSLKVIPGVNTLSPVQQMAKDLNYKGYEYGEQIHDLYSELGYLRGLIDKS